MAHYHFCKFHNFSTVESEKSNFPFLHKIKNSNNFIFCINSNLPLKGDFLIAEFEYLDIHGFKNVSKVFCPIVDENNKTEINNEIRYTVNEYKGPDCSYGNNDIKKENFDLNKDWNGYSTTSVGKTGCSPFSYLDLNGIVRKEENNIVYIPMFCFNDDNKTSYFAYCVCSKERYDGNINGKITASTQWAHCSVTRVTPKGLIHDAFRHIPNT